MGNIQHKNAVGTEIDGPEGSDAVKMKGACV
jgi:hypothetical protein